MKTQFYCMDCVTQAQRAVIDAARQERKRVLDWLRHQARADGLRLLIADQLERGEHLKNEAPGAVLMCK